MTVNTKQSLNLFCISNKGREGQLVIKAFQRKETELNVLPQSVHMDQLLSIPLFLFLTSSFFPGVSGRFYRTPYTLKYIIKRYFTEVIDGGTFLIKLLCLFSFVVTSRFNPEPTHKSSGFGRTHSTTFHCTLSLFGKVPPRTRSSSPRLDVSHLSDGVL